MAASTRLLALLLGFCAANGVSPEAPNAWHAWKTFKSFARATAEVPDAGVSIQLVDHGDGLEHLALVRQVLEGDGKWLRPKGGVVWELTFPKRHPDDVEEVLWSLDYQSFDDFVDAVEQNEHIADLLKADAVAGSVYWESAD
jgi:hypothetical protein